MHYKTKITKVGNSSAIILPKELLEQMNLEQGDAVYLAKSESGFSVSALDEQRLRQMERAREIMKENRNMLKKLAQ